MKFFNREKEITELLNILEDEPNNIYFIFGPINSGKTTLIKYIIENKLDRDEYVVFYINLREHFISKYEDFISVLFKTYEESFIEKLKRYFLSFIKDLPDNIDIKSTILTGIPVPKNTLKEFLSTKNSENVFEYLTKIFEDIKKKGKLPILIIDELQKIEDLKINGFLIYELFNFFIDLTKEKHLCHVFCLSSDSLFIERVYDEAMLRDRVDYILVDDFDKETTLKFMDFYAKEKNITLSNDDKELIYGYLGGKPILIIKVINKMKIKNLNDTLNELLNIEISKLEDFLEDIKEGKYNVNYEEVINALKLFKDNYSIPKSKIKKNIRNLLIKKNYLFLNPINNEIKPQTFLIWNAIKRVL